MHSDPIEAPEISVIIPSYNSADCVMEAVDSVFRQTMSRFEVIVVDDGSTDQTQAMLQPLEADPRFRCIRQAKAGAPNARNSGAKAARGKYVAFLDADDRFAPDALRLITEAMNASGSAWCITGVLRVNSTSQTIRRTEFPPDLRTGILRDDFVSRAPAFRLSSFLELGMFDGRMLTREDWDINIRAFLAWLPFSYVDAPVYIYRAREGSLSRDTPKMLNCTRRLLGKHHKAMADAGNPDMRKMYAELLWALARRYIYSLHDWRTGAACMAESLYYDLSPSRVLHPFHRLAQRISTKEQT